MLKIGGLQFPTRVILAPMAGVTDSAFRKIIRRYHQGLLAGEMISALALHYHSRQTNDLLKFAPEELPLSLQIFGSDPVVMAEAAQTIEASGITIIDINMGCPVPKIVKNGEGAALLNNLPLAETIIKSVVNSVKVPVTVKCRLGWDRERIVAPELARLAEAAGAAAIMVHGRTREQFYHGPADWDRIREVQEQVAIPVIGNGSVDSPETAQSLLEQTGCAGVMIGQAVLGRPWLLGQVATCLETGAIAQEPNLTEKFQVILEHLRFQIEQSGVAKGVKEMRKHFTWYFKGMPGSARMREVMNTLITPEGVREAITNFAAGLGVDPAELDSSNKTRYQEAESRNETNC